MVPRVVALEPEEDAPDPADARGSAPYHRMRELNRQTAKGYDA